MKGFALNKLPGWFTNNVFAAIAAVIIVIFVGTWLAVLIPFWQYTVDPAAPVPAPVLGSGLVLAAGLLATTLGTQSASSLGFAVAEVRHETRGTFTAQAVAKRLSGATYAAIFAYLLVGLAVFITWLVKQSVAPEVLTAFALSLLGWLIGAAGVIFKPLSDEG
jgi:hypothetical protein